MIIMVPAHNLENMLMGRILRGIPLKGGLEPSPEQARYSSPANRTSPAELSGSSSKPQPSSALARSLPPVISDPELLSQPTLISSPISTGTLFAHTVFQTKRQDTGKTYICLASDIRNHSRSKPGRLRKLQWSLEKWGHSRSGWHTGRLIF